MLITEYTKCRFVVTMTLDEFKAIEHCMVLTNCDQGRALYIMCSRGYDSLVAGMKSSNPLEFMRL